MLKLAWKELEPCSRAVGKRDWVKRLEFPFQLLGESHNYSLYLFPTLKKWGNANWDENRMDVSFLSLLQ